jgi:tetratricopeptide (TPR) repeat protein
MALAEAFKSNRAISVSARNGGGPNKKVSICIIMLALALPGRVSSQSLLTPEAAVQQAGTLLANRQYNDAVLLLNRVIQANPGFERAFFERGTVLFTMDVRRIELSSEAQYSVGTHLRVGFNATISIAVADYREAVRLDPRDAKAWCMLGKIYMYTRHDDEAMQAFDTAIQLDSKYALAYASRGLLKTDHGIDGAADIKRAFAIDPSLHKDFDSQLEQAHQSGKQVQREGMNARILDGAMQQWARARTEAQVQAVLTPWRQYGQIKIVDLQYYDDYDRYVTLTFRAVEIWVTPFSNRLAMRVWVPLRQADCNAIPQGSRIPLLAPPGVAVLDPNADSRGPFEDLRIPIGQVLDSLYLEKYRRQ